MAVIPEAEWRGPLPASNFAHGNRTIIGMTVHHMDGSWQSADATFKTPGRGSSACYGVTYDGHIIAWLDPTIHVDYHACQAQWEGYFGVENESDPNNVDAPLTDAQVAANARIALFHQIPARVIQLRGQGGIGFHRQFPGDCSVAWGQTDCPGDGIETISVPAIVAAMTGQGEEMTDKEWEKLGGWMHQSEDRIEKYVHELLGQWLPEMEARIIKALKP